MKTDNGKASLFIQKGNNRFILNIKLEQQDEMPLMSVRDARLLVIAINFATQKEVDLCMEHIRIRHKQRQADIDRYYRE